MQGFEESGISVQFSVWAKRENSQAVKNRVLEEVKERFRDHQINIPIRLVILYQAQGAGLPPTGFSLPK